MTTSTPDELLEIRRAVGELCDRFPGEYWRSLEPDRYPEEFVRSLTEHGWLAALIPEEYGGAGLGLTAASVVLEEVNASGGKRRRVPCADVHDGDAAPAPEREAEAALPTAHRIR
jgi:acyl-CoA dehydrogenase